MNRIELPVAVRLTAAAFAVFMTTTMIDGMVGLAGPETTMNMPQHVAMVAQQPARRH